MARIYFVRHGKAAAGFSEDPDPGLDAVGRSQAETIAPGLIAHAPVQLVSSPLRRARETALPVETGLGQQARIVNEVAEIPSPTDDLEARGIWLRARMQENWSDMAPEYRLWRQGVVDVLLGFQSDTVVFSHFIAINAAIGHATGDDRLLCFSPDNCSVTVFDNGGGQLKLVELGRSAATRVN